MRNEEILRRTEEGMRESNKVLIRELVRDFEERGITPAWAVDGQVTSLKLATKSRAEGFEKELKKSDFCLMQETKNKSLHIFVVQKTSGKVKIYKGSHWIDDFHHDVQKKFFN